MSKPAPAITMAPDKPPPNTPPAVSVGDTVIYAHSRYLLSPATVTRVFDNEYGQLDLDLHAVVYEHTDFDRAAFHRQVVQKLRPETRGKVRYTDPTIIWRQAESLTQSRVSFVDGIQTGMLPDRVRRTVPFPMVNLIPGTWFNESMFSYEIRCIKAEWDEKVAKGVIQHHDRTERSIGPFTSIAAAHKKWWKQFKKAGPVEMGFKWDPIEPNGTMGVTMWAVARADGVAADVSKD